MRLRLLSLIIAIPCGVGVVHAEPQMPCDATLDGHVVDVASHDPIVAATVSVGGELLALTDAAGRFTLRGLCSGEVTIVIERPDYEPERRTLEIDRHASLEAEMPLRGEVI